MKYQQIEQDCFPIMSSANDDNDVDDNDDDNDVADDDDFLTKEQGEARMKKTRENIL